MWLRYTARRRLKLCSSSACLLWFLLSTNGRHRGRSLQSLEHSHTSLCSPIYHVSVAVTPLNRVGSLSLLYENAKSKFVFRYYEAVAVVIKYFFLMSLSVNAHVLIVCMSYILLTHIPPCVSQRESKSPLDFHSRVCTRFEAIIWYFAVWKIFFNSFKVCPSIKRNLLEIFRTITKLQ